MYLVLLKNYAIIKIKTTIFVGTSLRTISMLAGSRPYSVVNHSTVDKSKPVLSLNSMKSTAQLWEALLNYDAIYAHLHHLDYGPKVLLRVVVHWYSFAHLGARQLATPGIH